MSVSIEREAIFLLDTPEMQMQGERIALAERTEIFKTDDQHHPIEIHVTQFKGFKRERGVVFYLSPEMVRAIRNATIVEGTVQSVPAEDTVAPVYVNERVKNFDFKKFKNDKRPHKPGTGWAPGGYTAVCCRCEASFLGEKRSTECADCAYGTPPAIPKEVWDTLEPNAVIDAHAAAPSNVP